MQVDRVHKNYYFYSSYIACRQFGGVGAGVD